jgi:glycosyltransferase involved in cell wall biosynthesis
MTKKSSVLYLVYREGLAAVIASTALVPQGRLRQAGWSNRLLFLAPLGEFLRPAARRRWRDQARTIREIFGGPFNRIPSPPSRFKACWDEAALLVRWAARHYPAEEPLVLHCRNIHATRLGLALRRKRPASRVIYDLRGLVHAEQADGKTDEALFQMEKEAARASDALICVSRPLGEVAEKTFGVSAERITVIPNCADVEWFRRAAGEREALRRQYGLSDKLVVAYCANLRWWQQPEEHARMFKMLHGLAPEAHLLALVRQPEELKRVLREAGVTEREATVLCVPFGDIPRHLAAADLAIMLRAPNPANRASAPLKFGEYLASGLPVIIADGIGDYSEMVRAQDLGVVLRHGMDEQERAAALMTLVTSYRRDPAARRDRCRRVAQEQLSWDVHLPRLAALYDRLMDA